MNRPIRILHLEDSQFDSEITERELKISHMPYERLWVTNRNDFIKALHEFVPDVILSDHSLPSFSSVQAIKIIQDKGLNIPFILITGTISEEFAAAMIKEGASDYLLKDHLKRLPEVIRMALKKSREDKLKKEFFEEMVKNEHRFRAIVENIPIGIMLVNRQGGLLYQNAASIKISGYVEDPRNRNIFKMVHPDDLPDVLAFYGDIAGTPGAMSEIDYRILHNMEHYIHIRVHIKNLLDDDSIKALMVYFSEIGHRKT